MPDLSEALSQLYAVEGALSIASPIAATVKKVWPFFPKASTGMNDFPCITHAVAPTSVAYESGGWKRVQYAVHSRLVVYDADLDQAAAITMAFVEPLIDAYAANIKLGLSGWMVRTVRFNADQPVVYAPESDSNGRTLVGLDYYVDLEHHKVITIAAGDPPA